MEFVDIRKSFERALYLTLNKKKWLVMFMTLVACGTVAAFFRALASLAGKWLLLSLTFLPIFLSTGVLGATGIFLIRIYHDEVKRKDIGYRATFYRSFEEMTAAGCFSFPLILVYLVLWMLLGVFYLMQSIPVFGNWIAALLIFAPFLINLASLVLCLGHISLLFFATPALSLNRFREVPSIILRRVRTDPFSNLVLALIALFPLIFFSFLLLLSARMTGRIGDENASVVSWFFIMLPFVAVLAPAFIFFFNFSAEAHSLLQKETKKSP